MKRILSLLLACAFLLALLPAPAAAASGQSTLKIGLYYGNNAMVSANLQNVTGMATGYQLGYYDANRSFVPLYATDEVYLTVVKDKAVYIGSGNVYFDSAPASYTTCLLYTSLLFKPCRRPSHRHGPCGCGDDWRQSGRQDRGRPRKRQRCFPGGENCLLLQENDWQGRLITWRATLFWIG